MKTKVASVIFINEKNKLLLYLRDDKPSIPLPNLWCTLGGHVEEGESIKETLKREIQEEIGYDIKEPVFLEVINDEVGNIVYVYKKKINLKINELILTEGQRLGYFSLEEIKELKMPLILKKFILENKDKIFCKR